MIRAYRTQQTRGALQLARQHERVSLEAINCPICEFGMQLIRHQNASFDQCGFETYRLTCAGCGKRFSVTVDLSDEALLLSPIAD